MYTLMINAKKISCQLPNKVNLFSNPKKNLNVLTFIKCAWMLMKIVISTGVSSEKRWQI